MRTKRKFLIDALIDALTTPRRREEEEEEEDYLKVAMVSELTLRNERLVVRLAGWQNGLVALQRANPDLATAFTYYVASVPPLRATANLVLLQALFRAGCLPAVGGGVAMTPNHQSPAEPLLPAEVWAKIFSYLQPTNPPLDLNNGDVHLIGSLQAQRTFCGLPLVCKYFMDVLRRHPELPSCAVFRQELSSTHLASLGAWLHVHGLHIQSVTSTSKAQAENQQLLAALSRSNSKLETALFTLTSRQHISVLGCISHLRSCTLHGADMPGISFLDLASFQHLPHLKDLGLMHGRFCTVSAAAHLTQLSCSHCAVSVGFSQDSFVDTLIQLRVVHSIVRDLDDLGICACTALRDLKLSDCIITASKYQESLYIRRRVCVLNIPAGLSSLTDLTDLCIAIPSFAGEKVNLAWLYGLVTLERLQLDVCSCVTLNQGLEALTRLCVLSVSCAHDDIILAVDWASLAGLQKLEIYGYRIKLNNQLLGLSNLEQLTSVSIDKGRLADDTSKRVFAILVGALRADVCLELHGPANFLSDEITTNNAFAENA